MIECNPCYPGKHARILKEKHRISCSTWAKNNPDKVKQANKGWLDAHPELKEEKLATFAATQPERILRKAGIDNEFYREQLKIHRENKLARENVPISHALRKKIEAGMGLMHGT